MPNDLRTIELLIKATTEQGVSERTAQQLQQIAANLDGIGKSAGDATGRVISMTEAVGKLTGNREMAQVAEQFRAVAQAAGEAGTQVDNLTNKTKNAGGGRFGGTVGPGGLGFAEFLGGMAVRALPKGEVGQVLGSSLLGAGSINSIISQIQQMSQSMGGLGNALGALITGLGPVTAGFLALNTVVAIFGHVNDEAQKSVEAQTEALRLYYKTIEAGTTATIEKAIAENEREQAASKGVIEGLKSQIAGIRPDESGEGADLRAIATRNALQGQLDKEQQTLDALTKSHDALTKALSSEEVAARDAALARIKAGDQATEEAVREGKLTRTGTSKGLTEEINELTDTLTAKAQQLGELNKIAVSGSITPEEVAKQKALIEDINNINAQLGADKLILPIVQAREREKQAIDDILKAQDQRNKELQKELDSIQRLNEQIDQLQADRDKQVKREDEQTAIDAERTGITRDYERRIQEAKDKEAEEDHQREIAKMKDAEKLQERRLTEGYNRQVDRINAEFQDGELKALQDFREKEADDLAKFNKKYARALEDLQDKLTDAASRRDVAGFIQAQRDGEKQLRRMAEDFQDQDKEQVAHFLKEREAARDNRAKQLAEAERGYREQLQLMRDQLADRLEQDRQAHMTRIRQSDVLEHQFQQLRDSWQIEDNMRRRRIEQEDFDERMAILKGQLAQQRALMQATLGQIATAPFQAPTLGAALAGGISAVNTIGGNAPNIISNFLGTLGGSPVSNAPTVTIGAPLPTWQQNHNLLPDRFANGLSFAPHDFFPAYLDYGERVLTRRQNEAYSSGRSGGAVVNIYNTVGDVATKQMLVDSQVEIVRGVRSALKG